MTLAELADHTANVRSLLEHKRREMWDADAVTASVLRFQIAQLEPRVTELEAQCARLGDAAPAA